jgi:ubiquinone/menaquinone biosynthesis C-methylase UbiE
MGHHTFDPDRAAALDDESRYRFLSWDELHTLLGPHAGMCVADLGSGTGFYTDDVAALVERCYAVDVQSEMHDLYRAKGVPENVDLVTAEVSDLPFDDNALDAALSTMTYHEFVGPASAAELARVCRPGARLVTVDWSADGDCEAGRPADHREALASAVETLEDVGFSTVRAATRPETFVHVGVYGGE